MPNNIFFVIRQIYFFKTIFIKVYQKISKNKVYMPNKLVFDNSMLYLFN
jgi:hypothetical protein